MFHKELSTRVTSRDRGLACPDQGGHSLEPGGGTGDCCLFAVTCSSPVPLNVLQSLIGLVKLALNQTN